MLGISLSLLSVALAPTRLLGRAVAALPGERGAAEVRTILSVLGVAILAALAVVVTASGM